MAPNEGNEAKLHDQAHGPEIHVVDNNSMRKVHFRLPWGATLQQVWDRAYVELKEAHRPEDDLFCKDTGTSLKGFLGLSLQEIRKQNLCPGFHFEIHGPSGGACHA